MVAVRNGTPSAKRNARRLEHAPAEGKNAVPEVTIVPRLHQYLQDVDGSLGRQNIWRPSSITHFSVAERQLQPRLLVLFDLRPSDHQ